MADETRDISINVQAAQAIRSLTTVGTKLGEFNSLVGASDRKLSSAERTLAQYGQRVTTSAKVITELRESNKSLGAALRSANGDLDRQAKKLQEAQGALEGSRAVIGRFRTELSQSSRVIDTQTREITRLKGALDQLKSGYNAVSNGVKLPGLQNLQQQFAQAGNLQRNALGGFSQGGVVALSDITKKAGDAEKATRKVSTAMHELADPTIRYALYSTAASFGILSAAGVKAYAELFSTGLEFEKNFANVIRTSQVSSSATFENSPLVNGKLITASQQATLAVGALQQEFLDLQTQIPVTSQDLATIGTLAAQMGIAASDVAEFTETTAKFAATAGVSADEAATALARVGQLTGADKVANGYERLASSILKTGVNAIATEQQIVRGTTQIASLGKLAGLTTPEVVALSSAMSSLGLSPELQRSVITSSMTKILNAVRGASSEAEKFGRVMGLTGKQFQDAFNQDAYGTYQKLLASIAKSPNAIAILQELGLASQRLTPNLLKMGQAYELFSETRADAQKGWDEDTELTRQYSIIAATAAAKIQTLAQTFQKLLTVMGAPLLKAISGFADGLKDALNTLAQFAQSPVGGFITQLVLGMGLVATAVALVATVVTAAGAGFLGFQFVIGQLAAQAGVATAGVGGLGVATTIATTRALAGSVVMTAYGNTMLAAGIKAGGLSNALKGLGLSALSIAGKLGPLLGIGLAVWAAQNETEITKFGRSVAGLSNDLKDVTKELESTYKGVQPFTKNSFQDISIDTKKQNFGGSAQLTKDQVKNLRSLGGFTDLGLSGRSGAFANIKLVDEQLSKLAGSKPKAALKQLEDLQKAWVKGGQSNATFAAAFPDTFNALALQTGKAGDTTEAIRKYYDGIQEGNTVEEQQALTTSRIADNLGTVGKAYSDAQAQIDAFTGAFKSGSEGFFDIGSLVGDNYKGLDNLKKSLDDSLVSFGTWRDGIQELTAKGAGDFAQAMAAQGPASQKAVADALKLGPDALASLNQSFADAAFFASQEYANAFAQDNATLADVYKKAFDIDPKTALDALHDTQAALKDGVITAAEALDLKVKYGVTVDADLTGVTAQMLVDQQKLQTAIDSAKPVEFPAKVKGPDGALVDQTIQGYQIAYNGHEITLPVDPNTAEGEAILNNWIATTASKPIGKNVDVKTEAATATIEAWRQTQMSRGLTISATVNLSTASAEAKLKNLGTTAGALGVTRKKDGGFLGVQRFADGGMVRGPGGPRDDKILALLSNTEYVMQSKAHRYYGSAMMDAINNLRFPRFANGGAVGGSSGGAGNITNVYATVNQNNPVTRDPIRQLKSAAENVIAGIWTE